jgi:hypothetical protein
MNLMSEGDGYLMERITRYLDDTNTKYVNNKAVNDFIDWDSHSHNTFDHAEYFDNIHELMCIAEMLRRRRDRTK